MSLSAAQKTYINHLVVKHHDERHNIAGGSMSDALFARDVLKCHVNTLTNWKKQPEFADALDRAIAEYEEGHDYFRTVLRHKALEELWLQYTKAAGVEKRHYLSMILKETEDVEQYSNMTDYTSMTDRELSEIFLQKKLDPPEGITVEQLKQLSSGVN